MTLTTDALKSFLRHSSFLERFRDYRQERLYRKCVKEGKSAPSPHLVKQQIIQEYARKLDLKVFVETGTYMGDMVNAVKDVFEKIYSIELGAELCRSAKERFAASQHITILEGDSGQVLEELLPCINESCLFWLDGHYSAGNTAKGDLETPIQQELSHIFKQSVDYEHLILIDDARCFTGEADYPTIASLETWSKTAGFNYFEVKDDIIRIRKAAN